jgi:hypothetical protein
VGLRAMSRNRDQRHQATRTKSQSCDEGTTEFVLFSRFGLHTFLETVTDQNLIPAGRRRTIFSSSLLSVTGLASPTLGKVCTLLNCYNRHK